MQKKLVIIKLGGSVITDKSKSIPTPRLENINNLSSEISDLYKLGKYKFILVHGAGSYGHPIAKMHSLYLGMKTVKQKMAFSKINQAMLDLNKIIMQNLIKKDLPVINFIPHTFIIQTAGKFTGMQIKSINQCLINNQIPVLYGDCVLDSKWGCSILSGDTIVSYLAQKLGANKVIFMSDVNGIYDSDPKQNPQAKLIRQINNKNLAKVLTGLTSYNKFDVTGEMKGKILKIKKDLRSIEVNIINGLNKNNLKKIMQQNQIGTRLQFD